MVKVSVIIPTYNYGEFIGDAIDSVLNQTYKDYEIIIVDDGSTDNTIEILEEYRDKADIRYFYQENKGPAAARNLGVKKSTGKYISFLDADDVYVPEKLEEQVDILNNNKKVGLVYSDFLYTKKNLHSNYYHYRCKSYDNQEKALQHLWRENYINTSTVMTVKDYLLELGLFNEKFRYAEDYDLWMRLGKNYKFYCIHKPLVKTRSHKKNLCKKMNSINKVEYTREVRRNIKEYYKEKGTYNLKI